MKKYIIALSTLLCASALHGAASQPPKKPRDLFAELSDKAENPYQKSGDPIMDTILGLLKEQTPDPSHNLEKGAQVCDGIEKWWGKMQKSTMHTDFPFTHQALTGNLRELNELCLSRKKILAKAPTHEDKILIMEADDIAVKINQELEKDFALVQSMTTSVAACQKIDLFKKNPTLNTPKTRIAIRVCHMAKEFCANVEQASKGGHRINDSDKKNFIGGTHYLAEYVASIEPTPEKHTTPVPSADMRT